MKEQLVSLLAAINYFTVHLHCRHCAGPVFATSSTFNVKDWEGFIGEEVFFRSWRRWISQASWCASDIPTGTCHLGPFPCSPPLKGSMPGAIRRDRRAEEGRGRTGSKESHFEGEQEERAGQRQKRTTPTKRTINRFEHYPVAHGFPPASHIKQL